jgi:hypothetical protein
MIMGLVSAKDSDAPIVRDSRTANMSRDNISVPDMAEKSDLEVMFYNGGAM